MNKSKLTLHQYVAGVANAAYHFVEFYGPPSNASNKM
jgi:hypothetical protein